MATVLPDLPNQWFDDNGQVLANGLIYTYDAGTSNPRTTWVDAAETVPNANPVVLNASGEATIFWRGSYRIEVRTSAGVLVRTIDNVETSDSLVQDLRDDLANTSNVALGDNLIGVRRFGGTQRTLDFYIKTARVNLTDFMSDAQADDVLTGAGTLDVSGAFPQAVAALPAGGGVIVFPRGRLLWTSPGVFTKSIIVEGDGEGTVIAANNATNDVFTVSTQYSQIRHLAITSAVARTAGGWYISSSASNLKLRGLRMLAGYEFIRTTGTPSGFDADDIRIDSVASANSVCFRLSLLAANLMKNIFIAPATQPFAGIIVERCGDLQLTDSQLLNCARAMELSPDAVSTVASVNAVNTFFDGGAQGLVINPAGTVVRCRFTACDFTSNSIRGVLIDRTGAGVVNGIEFYDCNNWLNTGDGYRVANSAVVGFRVDGGTIAQNGGEGIFIAANTNEFFVSNARIGNGSGLGGNGDYGVFVSAGTSANYLVRENDMRGNVTGHISDGGTGAGKDIGNNVGLWSGSAVYDAPNLADGAGATTTVTVTGAALGDFAFCSFSLDLQGITVTAWVSAANTVSVRFQNETGGALDLASGTLRAWVERRT